MAAHRKIETGSWVFDRESGELVPSGKFYARKYMRVARSDVPFPNVVSDSIELKSMADGKMYTSKRAYYGHLKATGHEIVGGMNPSSYVAKAPNEKQHEADIAADVRRAIQEVSSR